MAGFFTKRAFHSKPRPADLGRLNKDHPHLKYCDVFYPLWEGAGDISRPIIDRRGYGELSIESGAWRPNGVFCNNTQAGHAEGAIQVVNDTSGPWNDAFTTCVVRLICTLESHVGGPLCLFDIGGSGNGMAVQYRATPDTLGYRSVQNSTGVEIISTTTFAADSYIDIWCVFDAGAMEFIINNVSEGTGTNGTSMPAHGDGSAFGGTGGSSNATGNDCDEWGGDFEAILLYNSVPDRAVIRDAFFNPWAMFERRAWIPVTADTGASVTLTGHSSTTGLGTLASAGGASVDLTGNASTSAVGSIGSLGGAALVISGHEATTGLGALSVGNDVLLSLTGVESTSALGTITATGGAILSLTGHSATGQLGSITVETAGDVTVNLTGLEATPALGTLTQTTGAQLDLTGLQATSGIGSLSVVIGATVVELTGITATGEVGDITVTGDAIVQLTGVETLSGLGTLVTLLGREGHVIGTITINPATSATISLRSATSGNITLN